MTRVFAIVFTLMTAGAGYLTLYDVGVMDGSIARPSVRQGSAGSRSSRIYAGGLRGGSRGGK